MSETMVEKKMFCEVCGTWDYVEVYKSLYPGVGLWDCVKCGHVDYDTDFGQ